MKLENAIKQKTFQSPLHKMIVNITYTGSWLEGETNHFLKKFGISSQQYNVLRILRGQYPDPATVMLITDRMLDKMSNASRLVEKLRKKDFIERKICPDDRRRVDVIITDKGLALLDAIENEFKQITTLFSHLSSNEIETLNNLLDKVRSQKEAENENQAD